PDNVLFDDGKGRQLRRRLMNWCDLHTILRLPMGIFYAQGVKTNVLFFTRAKQDAPATDATEAVWIYDMRSGAPAYGKTNPLKMSDFDDFVAAFGGDPTAASNARTRASWAVSAASPAPRSPRAATISISPGLRMTATPPRTGSKRRR